MGTHTPFFHLFGVLTICPVNSIVSPEWAVDGLITAPSTHSVDVSIEKFEVSAKDRVFVAFAHLDHAAAADAVGLKMPRAIVIVLGNPRLDTPAFIKTPTLAIDLPLKAMAWEDSAGRG